MPHFFRRNVWKPGHLLFALTDKWSLALPPLIYIHLHSLHFPPLCRFSQMDCDGHLAQCLSEMNTDMVWWCFNMSPLCVCVCTCAWERMGFSLSINSFFFLQWLLKPPVALNPMTGNLLIKINKHTTHHSWKHTRALLLFLHLWNHPWGSRDWWKAVSQSPRLATDFPELFMSTKSCLHDLDEPISTPWLIQGTSYMWECLQWFASSSPMTAYRTTVYRHPA